jgi:S-DNA-T family DNA segregation ATPase FtsK/SpoIIIE
MRRCVAFFLKTVRQASPNASLVVAGVSTEMSDAPRVRHRDGIVRGPRPCLSPGGGALKLKVVLESDRGSTVDIVVEIDATARISDLVTEIVTADPHRNGPVDASGLSLAVAELGTRQFKELAADKQVGEAEIRSGDAVRVVPSTLVARAGNAAVLRVVGGPDVGKEVALPLGSSTIGRATSADITLSDPLVSRLHARIEVGRTIDLVDLKSANGLLVDGGVVRRVRWQPGQVVTLGDTQLEVIAAQIPALAPPPPGPVGETSGGSVMFNRSPVVQPRYASHEHPRPEVPAEIVSMPFPWLLMVAPVVLGLAAAIIPLAQKGSGAANPATFVLLLGSPLMLSASFLMQRRRQQATLDAQIQRFTKQLQALDAQLTAASPTERSVRNAEAPTAQEVIAEAQTLRPGLWTRRPEHWNFLHLRLGTGRAVSRHTVAEVKDRANGLPEYDQQLEQVVAKHRFVDGVPLVESLALCGGLGIAGPSLAKNDTARSLLAQLIALHSPAEVVVAALGGVEGAHEFEWLKWIPHTSSPQSPISGAHLAAGGGSATTLLTELEAIVAERSARQASSRLGALTDELAATTQGGSVGHDRSATDPLVPAIVLLVTDDAPVDRARLVQLAEQGVAAGVYTVWTAPTSSELPALCRTFLEVSDGPAIVNFVRHGVRTGNVLVERLSRSDALTFGRMLAPIVDAGAFVSDASDLPRSISTLTLLGREFATDPAVVVDRWRQNFSINNRTGTPKPRKRAGTLHALVGQAGVEAMYLDLRTHGPHALVGGTTGAGKSEFLQAWVLGMAAEHSPDRVTFLFVDYKGGSAFASCVDLPHSVGIVTDLSPHLVRRALESLKAELQRREKLFARKSVKDILDFERLDDPDVPPALIIVIDEFAALIGEVPEFVDGVVDVAQRGRSLGIHLIMATQRPAGVIRDNLRANTNLRIALRVADESDSVDVVGDPVAAGFDPGIPGRAIAKTGPGRLTPFQSGYGGGWTSDEPERPTVVVGELRFGADLVWEAPLAPQVHTDPGPNDLSRTVASLSAAAAAAGLPAPRRPWLEELGKIVDLESRAPSSDSELVLGLVDLPQQQAQVVAHWRPDQDGNLAVFGTGGSGKSVLLRTLAAGAGLAEEGGPVHVYAVDCAAGGLRMLEVLPHVGAVIPGDDSERVIRLFRYIKTLADDRTRRFSAANAENISAYRTLSGHRDEPRILLMLDGFASFRAEYEGIGPRGFAYSSFQQLIAEGRQLGIHLVFTADRPASVPGSIASGVPRRVVLRLAEEAMYRVLDVPHDILQPESAPGRAIIDNEEAQIALLGTSPNAADQFEELTKLAERLAVSQRPVAPPIKALPTEISLDVLPTSVDDLPVLGIGETDLAVVGFQPTGVMLVGGGPGSGRTNALLSLVAAMRRWRSDCPLFYLGNARSELVNAVAWNGSATTIDDVAELAKSLTADMGSDTLPGAVVVVEAIGDFLVPGTDGAVVALTKAAKRGNALLIAEADTGTWASSLPLFGEVKSNRRGLLLQPDTIEGDSILKTAFPRVARSDFPVGRGFYAARGKVERVQIPLAP